MVDYNVKDINVIFFRETVIMGGKKNNSTFIKMGKYVNSAMWEWKKLMYQARSQNNVLLPVTDIFLQCFSYTEVYAVLMQKNIQS